MFMSVEGGAFPLSTLQALLTHFRSVFDEKQAKADGDIKPKKGVNVDYDRYSLRSFNLSFRTDDAV